MNIIYVNSSFEDFKIGGFISVILHADIGCNKRSCHTFNPVFVNALY